MSPSVLGALLRDLAERSVRAFVATFLAAVAAGALNVVSVPSARALVVAAFGAAVSAAVSVIAGVTGTVGSASFNPANRGGLR